MSCPRSFIVRSSSPMTQLLAALVAAAALTASKSASPDCVRTPASCSGIVLLHEPLPARRGARASKP